MKEIKKYMDIVRYGKSYDHCFAEGDIISITEKIDGANASFVKDENNPDGFTCYSRNQPLHQDNQLRGFYQWCKDNVDPNTLLPNVRYFGEWACKHKVIYKDDVYNNFYLFSLYDDITEKYLHEDDVRHEATRLNLHAVRLFYYGEFISFEHLQSFIGQSDLTAEPNTGEGVVVKCVDKTDRYGRQLFLKMVSERFAEIQKQKLPKNPSVNNALIRAVVTETRVHKLLHKLVDEGILSEDYGIENIATILRNINVYEDVMEEESEMLVDYEDIFIRKQIGKITPPIVRKILQSEGRA